jgi:hypothetical protein
MFVDTVGELKNVAGAGQSRSTDPVHEAIAGNIAMEILERYLAAAAEERRAADERASEVIVRFSKLITAMVCMTMVIAGATLAMIFRQSSNARPSPAELSQPVGKPAVIAQQPQPVVSPLPAAQASPESLVPAKASPLLERPPEPETKQAPAPPRPRLARRTIAKPQPQPQPQSGPESQPEPQPLLSAESEEHDSEKPGPTELW